jgi:DNA-binding transcriptional regulator GbsR (MarR family)
MTTELTTIEPTAAAVAAIIADMDNDAADSTDIPEPRAPQTLSAEDLRRVEDRFIECWGNVGGLWGVSRSIGRVHALLFLAGKPLDMETVTERLQISHGNASTSLRDLLAWGVVRKVHLPGERKVLYESEKDPWTWFHTCIRERARREVVPVLQEMKDVHVDAKAAARAAPKGPDRAELERAVERIESFTHFMDEFMGLIDSFLAVGAGPMGKAFITLSKLMPKGNSRIDR